MHILVTGGTGFIGAPLVGALQRAGHSVVVLSRRPQLPRERLRFVAALDTLADGEPVDAVINLAGASSLANVDYVTVLVTTTHGFATDLSLTLTSPSGSTSRLMVGFFSPGLVANSMPGGSQVSAGTAQLVSWRHLGENGAGDWTLRVADVQPADVGVFNGWSIRLHGR